MGMFDYVNYEADCIECGSTLRGWQTKSTKCCMDTVEVWQVDNMYCNCAKCGTWNEYEVEADTYTIVRSLKVTLDKGRSNLMNSEDRKKKRVR